MKRADLTIADEKLKERCTYIVARSCSQSSYGPRPAHHKNNDVCHDDSNTRGEGHYNYIWVLYVYPDSCNFLRLKLVRQWLGICMRDKYVPQFQIRRKGGYYRAHVAQICRDEHHLFRDVHRLRSRTFVSLYVSRASFELGQTMLVPNGTIVSPNTTRNTPRFRLQSAYARNAVNTGWKHH